MKFEFLSILIRWHFGQPGQSAGFADFLEPFRRNREADGHERVSTSEQRAELLIGPPREDSVVGESTADVVDFGGSRNARLRVRGRHSFNGSRQRFAHEFARILSGIPHCPLDRGCPHLFLRTSPQRQYYGKEQKRA